MVAATLIGHRLPVVKARVEAGRLRAFRRTIGSADPSNPVAPPKYLFALGMLEAARPLAFAEELGVDLAKVLHRERSEYPTAELQYTMRIHYAVSSMPTTTQHTQH